MNLMSSGVVKVAEINDYYKEQTLDILKFNLVLINGLVELEETMENLKKIQLDLFAIKYDLELVLEMLEK